MSLTNPSLQKYIEEHTSEESLLLKKINRYTNANVLMPRMLSGHLQGRVLAFFSKMIKPKNILEIGTYTGYSALCLAEGLTEVGKLTTIDKNEELEDTVRGFFKESENADKIEYIIGKAVDVIPRLQDSYDIVFIDADKINYSVYYDLIFDKIGSGGFIIADNVLWSGKVIDTEQLDNDTKAILEFNKKIKADPRVEQVLFPVRDGLLVVRKL